MTVLEVVGTVALSTGLVGLLMKHLLAVQQMRLIEAVKAANQQDLEQIKNDLQLVRRRTDRFEDDQFKLYNELWASLYALEKAADALWREASLENFLAFGLKLNAAADMIGERKLLLEEADAQRLSQLMDALQGYHIGKKTLLELRREGEYIAPHEISQAIENNRDWRDQYKQVLERVQARFRERIRR